MENHYDLANPRRRMLARRRNHPNGSPMSADQSRQEPITRFAGSDEGFIVSEARTLAVLVLGGIFDHRELGDIEMLYEAPACEALQRKLVTSDEDVHVELVSRIDYDAAQSELAALREELAKFDDAMRALVCNLGVGGYNAEFLTGDQLANKVQWGIDNLLKVEQQRLTAAEQRNSELQRDKDRLDALESNFWGIRHSSHPIADTGDSSSCLEIIGQWMDKPFERVIGENYSENLRAAIDQAMTAPAYPPERPEYPEIDELLEQPTESGARE